MPDTCPVTEKASSNACCQSAAEVRPGEGASAVLLAVNVFVLLSAYYTIRPLRSALLLPVQIPLPGGRVMAGPEIQSYTGAILAALFLVIVPLYSALASRVDRIRLINSVTMFFVVTLIGFYFVGRLERVADSRRGDVLPLDGRLQPDDHRPVLVVRERPVHARTRASASSPSSDSAARSARSEARSSRATLIDSAGPPVDDADRQRRVADRARAHQSHSRARTAPAESGGRQDRRAAAQRRRRIQAGAQRPLSAPHRAAHAGGATRQHQRQLHPERDAGPHGPRHHRRRRTRTDGRADSSAASWPASISGRTCCPWSSSSSWSRASSSIWGSAARCSSCRSLSLTSYGAIRVRPGAGVHPADEDRRERDRLLAAEHRAARALPAHVTRGEVQGAPGCRNLLLARRRHAVRCLHLRPRSVAGASRFAASRW